MEAETYIRKKRKKTMAPSSTPENNSQRHRRFPALWLVLLAAALQMLPSLHKYAEVKPPQLDDDFTMIIQTAKDMVSTLRHSQQKPATIPAYSTKLERNAIPPLPVKVPRDGGNESGRMEVKREYLQRWFLSQMKVLVTNCDKLGTAEVRGMYCDAGGVSVSRAIAQNFRRSFCLVRMSSLSLRDRERVLMQENIVKFAIIRHPLVRALATYRRVVSNDTVLNSQMYRRFIARLRGYELTSSHRELSVVSFRVFLALSGQRLASMRAGYNERPFRIRDDSEMLDGGMSNEGHYGNVDDESISDEYELSPQWLLCAMDVVKYSSMVRVESIGKDLHEVFRKMGMTTSVVPELNVSEDMTEARRVYSDVRVRQRAWRLFRKDISTFEFSLTDLTK